MIAVKLQCKCQRYIVDFMRKMRILTTAYVRKRTVVRTVSYTNETLERAWKNPAKAA